MQAQKLVYQGPDPRALVEQVIEEHGPVRIQRPEKRRVGGIFGFFAKEVYVLTVDLDGADAPLPATSAPATSARRGDPLGAYLDATEDEVTLADAPGSEDARPEDAAKPFAMVLADVASSMGEAPGEYRPRHLPPPGARVTGARAPGARVTGARAPDASQVPAPAEEEDWAGVRGFLRRCGVPEPMVRTRPPDVPGRSTLEAVFARLPLAPPFPECSGGLVAVVGASAAGEGKLASFLGVAGASRRCARHVATAVGSPSNEIALVCEGVPDRPVPDGWFAQSPVEAASLSPGWRRDRVGVVVVHGAALGHDQRWTREVLAAMHPSQVLGVASGTTKVEDVLQWTKALGGVDALALVDMETTATPGAILSTGIPVRCIDDEAATPSVWARLVARRLSTE